MLYLNKTPIDVTMFPDNTSQVWKLDKRIIRDAKKNYNIIEWDFDHEGELIHLIQLKDLLDYYKVSCNLYLSYLPYGRQDKEVSNTTTFALNSFAKVINSLNFEDVLIMDPHSTKALELIKDSRPVFPEEVLISVLNSVEPTAVCFPDKGAKEKYFEQDVESLGVYEWPLQPLYPPIIGDKVRDQETGYIKEYKFEGNCKDKKVLIIDDICDGGMTFKLLAKDLKKQGAKEVHLFVTHGIFSKGIKTLKDSGIDRIFTKDGEISEFQNHICSAKLF